MSNGEIGEVTINKTTYLLFKSTELTSFGFLQLPKTRYSYLIDGDPYGEPFSCPFKVFKSVQEMVDKLIKDETIPIEKLRVDIKE